MAANELVADLHTRMPLIIDPTDFEKWLSIQTPLAMINGLLRPFPAVTMCATPVGPRVNKAGNEGPECIAPVEAIKRSVRPHEGFLGGVFGFRGVTQQMQSEPVDALLVATHERTESFAVPPAGGIN